MNFRPGLSRLMRWILLLSIFFVLLLLLLRAALYLWFPRPANGAISSWPAFNLGFHYDIRWVSLVALVVLVLGSIPILNPFRKNTARIIWMTVFMVLAFALIIFYVFDFGYYAYLSQRLNASALNFLKDAKISGAMIWQTYPVLRILLGILVFLALIGWFLRWSYRMISNFPDPSTRTSRIVGFIVGFLLFGVAIFGHLGQYPLRWSDAFGLGNDYAANLALNPMESFFNTMDFRNTGFDAEAARKYQLMMSGYLGINVSGDSISYFRTRNPKPVVTSKPNIVLVICESFSAYKSSMWGNKLNTTPFFNQLCENGMFFDRCFTPSFGTARGVWATLTGIPDVQPTQTASRNPTIVDQHIIINDFKGYDKNYFLGGSTSWANIRGLLSNNIHDLRIYEQDDFDAPKVDVWGISDKNLFLEANKILAKKSNPFFAVIQTADNHRPYTIPEEDRAEFKMEEFPIDTLRAYGFENNDEMNAFRYTDFCFQKFIEAARKEKYYENTMFVFVGDHGIPGDVGNLFPRPWTDLRLANMHVPLLFYMPGKLAASRNSHISSQVDVLPTIAGLCGIAYSSSALGRDLLDSSLYRDSDKQFAFFYDPEMKTIGAAKGGYFFRKQINGNVENFVSILSNDPVLTNDSTKLKREQLKQLAEATYSTAQFMLFHNKKSN
jgi:phosphoglycerol transferase MdoB-like AlkP superfamily enzyme